jgi:hypothetical protein
VVPFGTVRRDRVIVSWERISALSSLLLNPLNAVGDKECETVVSDTHFPVFIHGLNQPSEKLEEFPLFARVVVEQTQINVAIESQLEPIEHGTVRDPALGLCKIKRIAAIEQSVQLKRQERNLHRAQLRISFSAS